MGKHGGGFMFCAAFLAFYKSLFHNIQNIAEIINYERKIIVVRDASLPPYQCTYAN